MVSYLVTVFIKTLGNKDRPTFPPDPLLQMARPPSTGLLSILAILATASGSPTPASFLCPSHNKRHFTHSHPTAVPSSRIPAKFVQDDDGIWRHAESYTLYGSTFCCVGVSYRFSDPHTTNPHFSKSWPSSTQVDSSSDDRSDLSPTPVDDIRNSLPLGWSPTPTPNENRPTLILVLSLVLAFIICFFIIGCVFWRKSIIKRRKKDIEAELKKRPKRHSKPAAEDAKNMVEKESKAKLKVLARATARWKANIRHAARQRKGKRVVTTRSSLPSQPSHSSNNSRILSVSLHSRTSSRRSSVVSLPDELSQPIIDESPSSISLPSDPISTPTISPVATSPPAYHHDGQALPVIYSNISHATSLDRQTSSFRVISSTSNSFHDAHVATDDKTLLARLVDLASRPPEETSTDTLDACDTLVSAPAWHDGLEDIPSELIISNDHPPTRLVSSLFPPPPSKEHMEHMATGDLYDYSFSFEGTAALEPEPSAPPFHLDPGPLIDDHQIVPSAPPLLDTEFLVDVVPCAPRLDMGEESPAGQDHDRMPSVPLSDVSSASRRDIEVRDDITLPGYRP